MATLSNSEVLRIYDNLINITTDRYRDFQSTKEFSDFLNTITDYEDDYRSGDVQFDPDLHHISKSVFEICRDHEYKLPRSVIVDDELIIILSKYQQDLDKYNVWRSKKGLKPVKKL